MDFSDRNAKLNKRLMESWGYNLNEKKTEKGFGEGTPPEGEWYDKKVIVMEDGSLDHPGMCCADAHGGQEHGDWATAQQSGRTEAPIISVVAEGEGEEMLNEQRRMRHLAGVRLDEASPLAAAGKAARGLAGKAFAKAGSAIGKAMGVDDEGAMMSGASDLEEGILGSFIGSIVTLLQVGGLGEMDQTIASLKQGKEHARANRDWGLESLEDWNRAVLSLADSAADRATELQTSILNMQGSDEVERAAQFFAEKVTQVDHAVKAGEVSYELFEGLHGLLQNLENLGALMDDATIGAYSSTMAQLKYGLNYMAEDAIKIAKQHFGGEDRGVSSGRADKLNPETDTGVHEGKLPPGLEKYKKEKEGDDSSDDDSSAEASSDDEGDIVDEPEDAPGAENERKKRDEPRNYVGRPGRVQNPLHEHEELIDSVVKRVVARLQKS
jgi:hypothetical protein